MHLVYGSKISFLKDHDGKPLYRRKYGYVVAIIDCKDGPDGYMITEQGIQKEGQAYLIQTSWCSGATWYSDKALMHAGGTNRLAEWKKKLEAYNQKHA
jgi:hypothetical protein